MFQRKQSAKNGKFEPEQTKEEEKKMVHKSFSIKWINIVCALNWTLAMATKSVTI